MAYIREKSNQLTNAQHVYKVQILFNSQRLFICGNGDV